MSSAAIEIIFVQADGSRKVVQARPGRTLMEVAIENGIKGIVAECGGSCSCATCHVYIGDQFPELLGAADSFEEEMLSGTAARLEPDSRLSCQIKLEEHLSGLVIRIPDRQY